MTALGHRRTPSDTSQVDFKQLTRKEALTNLNKELGRLLQTAPTGQSEHVSKEFDGFERLFSRYLSTTGEAITWDKIRPPPEDKIKSYQSVCALDMSDAAELLNKLIVIKLNGGLGTTMGCQGPKSVINVRNDLTFLDLTVQQIEHLNTKYNVDVPLVLMNSFNTDEDTQKVLAKYRHVRVKIYCFMQSRYPRVQRETLLPIAKNASNSNLEWWYPPGHGDIYEALYNSAMLQEFIAEGKEYAFVSNIDNLGATVDLRILNLLLKTPAGHEFVMEVTDKTSADVKGGTLIQYEDKLRLLEIAQVPAEHVDEFKSVSKFKIFNTNNLWMNLKAMQRILESHSMHMEIIVNQKTLHGGVNVIQLETASGAAIKNFEGAIGINVPRSRFLPVKTTSDLLLIMSSLYTLRAGHLEMNPRRPFPSVPLVKLGGDFTKVSEFLVRFGNIPDCLELDHLTVAGDVTFGKNVILRGTVIIIANHGDRIDIPSGAILENKIVSGNLRILDH